LTFDDNSVEPGPIDLEPHMDSVGEEVDVRTLAYKMVRPYIVVVEVDYHTEEYVGSYGDCTHIVVWLDYTHKNHTDSDFDFDFDNSHKDLPFP